jgi:hypothetical protein
MNRHDRRRAKAMARENRIYTDYIRHLPVPDEIEKGRLYHMVCFHDDWCAIYSDKECNCDPIIKLHVEPERS